MAESSDGVHDEPVKELSAATRALQERLRGFITAMKELNAQPDAPERLLSLKERATELMSSGWAASLAFEALQSSRLTVATQTSANQLTQIIQVAVGKAPPDTLPALNDASDRQYAQLAELLRTRTLSVAAPAAQRERMFVLMGQLLQQRQAICQTAAGLLSAPRDEVMMAALSASAKSIAGGFQQIGQFGSNTALARPLTPPDEAEARASLSSDVALLRAQAKLLAGDASRAGLLTLVEQLTQALQQLASDGAIDVAALLLACGLACSIVAEAGATEAAEYAAGQLAESLHSEFLRSAQAVVHNADYLRLAGALALCGQPVQPPPEAIHSLAALSHCLQLLLQTYSSL